MLPNNFPDSSGAPQYNTVDAALCISRRCASTMRDAGLGTVQQLFPTLVEIVDAHVRGTRYNIKVDPPTRSFRGQSEVQLTWMDAKIGDWVVTPRIGKPWKSMLCGSTRCTRWRTLRDCWCGRARATRSSRRRPREISEILESERDCCFDVIDEPGGGNDASLRPNQIFSVRSP